MTGIIKTDQLQSAQGSTITIPSGNKISIIDSATVGTLNAATVKGVTTFEDSSVFSGATNFTGTMTGGNAAMVKVLNDSWTSAVSYYDVTSTYINSTYDNYYILWRVAPSTDTVNIMLRFFHDGAVDTGNNYGWETTNTFTNTTLTSNAGGGINLSLTYSGNATGENTMGDILLMDVNSTTVASNLFGRYNQYNMDGNHTGGYTTAGQTLGVRTKPVQGLRFMANSGNLASGEITVYGIKK